MTAQLRSASCEAVACPRCGARRGRRCIRPGGGDVRPGQWHAERVKAAARTDDGAAEVARS